MERLKIMKSWIQKNYKIIIFFLIIFAIGYALGQKDAKNAIPLTQTLIKQEPGVQKVDFSLFWDTWEILEEKYAEKENLNKQDMVYGAIKGLVASLEDPYSLFMDPRETAQFLEDMQGTFEGIGAEVGIRDSILTIIAPLKGMPAEKAGLRSGDKVIRIDETLTNEMTLDQAVRLIRGPKGTEVILTVVRGENGIDTHEIKITRARIDVPSVELELKEEEKIAYINLSQFSEDTEKEFKKINQEIIASNADKIILDLRNNPGGYLDIAVRIAGYFLPKDSLVAIEDFGGQKQNVEYRTLQKGSLKDYPLVVLVNQGSASASEILAGALRELRDIKLIGEKTFGKGSVQELTSLGGQSSLRLTVAKWLTPHGMNIHEQGLEPDIKVEMTEQDWENNRDPQMEEGIKVLR